MAGDGKPLVMVSSDKLLLLEKHMVSVATPPRSDDKFDNLSIVQQANMVPVMYDDIARNLGVSPDAVRHLGVGYWPEKQVYSFPERDEYGHTTGLMYRTHDGHKFCAAGSKRSFSYACLGTVTGRKKKTFEPHRHFVRVQDLETDCPKCGKRAGCMLGMPDDDGDPTNANAVLCFHVSEGAIKEIPGAGWLHILQTPTETSTDSGGSAEPEAFTDRRDTGTVPPGGVQVLPPSLNPVVVCEGASDGLYATTIGYVSVGLPSGHGSKFDLRELVKGRPVIVIGDLDTAGVGVRSAETTVQLLRPVCPSVTLAYPPEGFVDLRKWSPTRSEFDEYIAKTGVKGAPVEGLESLAPWRLAKQWLAEKHTVDGCLALRRAFDEWYRFNGSYYGKLDDVSRQLDRQLYESFDNREVKIQTPRGLTLKTIDCDDRFVAKMRHALAAICSINTETATREPFNVSTGQPISLPHAVAFQDGLYLPGTDKLELITPNTFLTSTLPCSYRCACGTPSVWLDMLNRIFEADDSRIRLLQQWGGYCLQTDDWLSAVMFFYGPPNSGKSTVSRVLQSVLGRCRCHSMDTADFSSRFGLSPLIGRYLTICDEGQFGRRIDTDAVLSNIKKISGGDLVPTEKKFQDRIAVRLFTKLLFVSNCLPPFLDGSGALNRRTHLLYFGRSLNPEEVDPEIETRLLREHDSITGWCLAGLKDLLRVGKFERPAACEEHLAGFMAAANPLASMIADCCVVGPPNFTASKDLYDLYGAWCKTNGVRDVPSLRGFILQLTLALGKKIRPDQKQIDGQRARGFFGVSINPTGYACLLENGFSTTQK